MGEFVALATCCCFGEELAGELVVAWWKAHGDLGRRAAVDLGRPAGSWSTAIIHPPVVDIEQTVVEAGGSR